jgi:hypothetical protein
MSTAIPLYTAPPGNRSPGNLGENHALQSRRVAPRGQQGGPDRQIRFDDISEYSSCLAKLERKGPFAVIELYQQDETGAWDRIPLPPA